MTDSTISVYRLSSGFLGWLAGARQRNGMGFASGGRNGLESGDHDSFYAEETVRKGKKERLP